MPVYAASNASITLSHINGTVGSPCGGVFGASQASQMVQIRQETSQHACLMSGLSSCRGYDTLSAQRYACSQHAAPVVLRAMEGFCHEIFSSLPSMQNFDSSTVNGRGKCAIHFACRSRRCVLQASRIMKGSSSGKRHSLLMLMLAGMR